MHKSNRFSKIVSVFQGVRLPEQEVLLAGYAALIAAYDLHVPLPDTLSAISNKHRKYEKDNWIMLTPRHAPATTLLGELTYALKYEGVNLFVLKALYDSIDPTEIIEIVQSEPTGAYSRRIWFLYEWLKKTKLNVPDAESGNLVDVVDDDLQFSGPSSISKRHRVRNNLPGTPDFCPMIRRTAVITEFQNMNLGERARNVLGSIHPDILMRAAAFMLLKDSKASFAIEGEHPSQNRAERWAFAIGQAGNHELSHDEFSRLQEIIISDFRFIHYGYRNAGGFIGEHERSTGMPIPEHVSAKPQDLYSLMDGLIATDRLLTQNNFDPILAAASIAFGFVFIHPFEDGNGRIHRYLIHHVLAAKNFISLNIIFPISAIILERIIEYRKVLESFSRPRLRFIRWRATEKGNLEVLNETADLYRYFDATKQAEFLYCCIKETIDKTLPEEVDYLKKYDEMKIFIKNYIDMPDRLIDLLIRFLIQEKGVLSNQAKRKEFHSLTQQEITVLENKFQEIFFSND
ncbi:MAG: Fic family protein [Gammaproteobacteria bacterium]